MTRLNRMNQDSPRNDLPRVFEGETNKIIKWYSLCLPFRYFFRYAPVLLLGSMSHTQFFDTLSVLGKRFHFQLFKIIVKVVKGARRFLPIETQIIY